MANGRCSISVSRRGILTRPSFSRRVSDPDSNKSKRVAEAMLKMVKLDIAGLEAAAKG